MYVSTMFEFPSSFRLQRRNKINGSIPEIMLCMAVRQAIFEAVLPRNAGDAIPKTRAGILVAVADRLDSLVGLFAAGAAPSASADPFALRRSAYGMLEVGYL
jgi:glycyl-tRNA synthetase beta subunit